MFDSRWNRKFSTLISARLDKTGSLPVVFSPKLSLLISPYERLRLRASAGRGFHAPSVQELYEEGYGHGGSAYRFGNPLLQPEYATSLNAGIEYEAVVLNADLIFDTRNALGRLGIRDEKIVRL